MLYITNCDNILGFQGEYHYDPDYKIAHHLYQQE